jgi:hypothetical protein
VKITIEFTGTTEATVTIDGREFNIGMVTLGYEMDETDDSTIGGLVASELFDVVPRLMQGWAAAVQEDLEAGTWDSLSDEAADACADAIR